MEGDLNLSQMLGGLRIANNVDTPPASPRLTPQRPEREFQQQEPSEQRSTIRINGQLSYDSATPPGSEFRHHSYEGNGSHSITSASFRPSSTFTPYGPNMANDASSSSAPLSLTASPAYQEHTRAARDQSRSSMPGTPPGNTWHPNRELSGSDRSFRQSTQFPPRGSSRGGVPGYGSGVGASGEPYGLDSDGPLSSSEEWKDRGAAVAIRKELDKNGNPTTRIVKKGVKDFNFGRTLGEGSYSTVLAATDRTTLKEYAIKVLDKRHIIKEKKVKYVNIEKNTLNRLGDHPGIVRLYYTFQDERSLYFVLDLATGGELLGFLKRVRNFGPPTFLLKITSVNFSGVHEQMSTFDEECTRFYGAQILDAVEYMHSRGVIHRDLKPENVLLDEKMHIKITDFGTAKILETPKPQTGMDAITNGLDSSIDDTRANSFVGTAEYVSPELLTDKAACKASDLWAFGCIIYQLLSGRPPFKAANEYQTFQKIVHLEYEFPKGFPTVARDLVDRLLVLDPAKRLTIEHIKSHPFFEGMEWGRKLWLQKAPRLKPYIPPPEETKIIRLNDGPIGALRNGVNGSSASTARPHVPPRVITELPPPSQLDIEWSPVLTRANERILKLGNATVVSAPAPLLPDGKGGLNGYGETNAPKKLSRFFTVGGGPKKRQRLVIVTTSARMIIAAAGGDDKRMKTEINLLGLGVVIRKTGGENTNVWAIDTRDKTYTFEDSKHSASEWLEACERAKEIAQANNPGDDGYTHSALSSPASTIGADPGNSHNYVEGERNVDSKNGDKDKRRFSKRHSRHGLAAVF